MRELQKPSGGIKCIVPSHMMKRTTIRPFGIRSQDGQERAKDPNAWLEKIITLSQEGPEALTPHERGQVAHMFPHMKVPEGSPTQMFPLPAEWLCVFDPVIRYMTPSLYQYLFRGISIHLIHFMMHMGWTTIHATES